MTQVLFTLVLTLVAQCWAQTTTYAPASSSSGSMTGTTGTGTVTPTGTTTSTTTSNLRVSAIPSTYYSSTNGVNSGFLVDLLDAITQQAGLTYTLTPSTLGYSNTNGGFDGTIFSSLINNQADLIGADLTATSAREAVVDFLLPWGQYSLQTLVNTQFGLTSTTQYVTIQSADLTYIQSGTSTSLKAIAANIAAGLPGSIVADDAAGLAKVLSGNFAYITESPFPATAVAANPGKVSIQPGNLGTFFLALAVQQGSPLRDKLNIAYLKVAESGALNALLVKYNYI